jgi:hypothetical protein
LVKAHDDVVVFNDDAFFDVVVDELLPLSLFSEDNNEEEAADEPP